MTFYNNNLVAIEKSNDGIYLARKINDDIIVDFVKNNTNIFSRKYAIENINGEFDVELGENKALYFTYLDSKNNLVLNRVEDGVDNKVLIQENMKGILELKLINLSTSQNIFYSIKASGQNLLEIYHINVINEEINVLKVDDVETYGIINPFRIIKDNINLIIAYYYKNQICIKEFDGSQKLWSPSVTLTDNHNRLYLDILKYGDYLHLVYADHYNDSFTIKYKRFLFSNDYILLERDIQISNSGNNTDPIFHKTYDTFWIVWKSTNQLFSVYSKDNGKSWSEIYMWKDTKYLDIVKYKYITDIFDDRVILDYAYGSVNKDIRFLGFGDLDGVESIKR